MTFKTVQFKDEQNETVSYTGQVLNHNKTNITINTKVGQMTFENSDVQILEANEQDFESSPTLQKESTVETVVTDKGGKMQHAIQVYKQMMSELDGQHPVRKDAINKFVSVCGLTEKGAATYQQTIKTNINKGKY